MIQHETLSLSSSCALEAAAWEFVEYPTEVVLRYTEHSSDHWHSDNQTSIDLTKEDAIKIIEFLTRHFKLEQAK